MAIQNITTNDFDKEVLKAEKPVIVDFFAEWCGPCKMMGPVFEETSEKFKGKIKFTEIDVDANQDKAMEYGVMSIPTLIIFNKGEVVGTLTGLQDSESLSDALEKVNF